MLCMNLKRGSYGKNKKTLIILITLIFAAPLCFAGELETLSAQYDKMQLLKTYYEIKVENLVINMSIVEKRFSQVKKQRTQEEKQRTQTKKAAAEKPVNNSVNGDR